jgi:hypothetical protein
MVNIYRTITLSVVLYVCETWSLALREERRLREFESRMLRSIFGPKRDEVGHVTRMGKGRGLYRVLVEKTEGKRLLGRPRHRWEDNIKINLQEVGCVSMDWIGLVQDMDR